MRVIDAYCNSSMDRESDVEFEAANYDFYGEPKDVTDFKSLCEKEFWMHYPVAKAIAQDKSGMHDLDDAMVYVERLWESYEIAETTQWMLEHALKGQFEIGYLTSRDPLNEFMRTVLELEKENGVLV